MAATTVIAAGTAAARGFQMLGTSHMHSCSKPLSVMAALANAAIVATFACCTLRSAVGSAVWEAASISCLCSLLSSDATESDFVLSPSISAASTASCESLADTVF